MSLLTVWDWKVEPESPGFMDLDSSEDVWLFDDNDVKQVNVLTEDDDKTGQPTTKAVVATKPLDDLIDLDEWIKEEPFNDWLEEKIDLPIFEDLAPLDQRSKLKSLDTLLQEFETVFEEVELNNGALTPPQSPPLLEGKMAYSIGSEGQLVLLQTLSVPEPTSVLDELVRSRAADIDTSCDPWDTSSSSTSPRNDSSESDFVLSPPESGSDSSNSGLEVCEDPEWVPVSVNPLAPKRKRGKPYARPVEDKKLRKKEQNKNAATRYRQKKKAEVDVIVGEEKGLVDRNTDLHKNVDELAREIKYLKGLMRDLFKAKGLLK